MDVQTARLCGHSKSDTMDYMSDEEKNKNQLEDPMIWLEKKLSENEIQEVKMTISCEIEDAFERANQCEEYILTI